MAAREVWTQAKEVLKFCDELYRDGEIRENIPELQNSIPVFVVLGMQSTGKSSVLSRICHVDFPVHSELCTKVRTQLCLRQNPQPKPIIVKGDAWNGENVFEETVGDSEKIASTAPSIQKAQKAVLDAEPGDDVRFSERGLIKIVREHPDVPTVTFVDLPGLFMPVKGPDEESRMVDSLVDTHIEGEATFVLHIVQADRDINQAFSWGSLQRAEAQHRCAIVFTKADLVKNAGELIARLDKAHENGFAFSNMFIVNSMADSNESELRSLEAKKWWTSCEEQLKNRGVNIGCKKLATCSEKLMLQHMNKCLTPLFEHIESSYQGNNQRLQDIGSEDLTPEESLALTIEALRLRLVNRPESIDKALRVEMDYMVQSVMSLNMRPVMTQHKVSSSGNEKDDEDCPLREGNRLFSFLVSLGLEENIPELTEGGFDSISKCMKVSRDELRRMQFSEHEQQSFLDAFKDPSRYIDFEPPFSGLEKNSRFGMLRAEVNHDQASCNWKAIIEDAHGIIDARRGLRATQMADPYIVTEMHAADFGVRCRRVLHAFVERISKVILDTVFEPVFTDPSPNSTGDKVYRALRACSKARRHMRQDFLKKFQEYTNQVKTFVDETVETLCPKETTRGWTVVTTNNHYLQDTERAFRRKMEDYLESELLDDPEHQRKLQGVLPHVSSAYSFLKVQQKLLPDQIQNYARLYLEVRARDKLVRLLDSWRWEKSLISTVSKDEAASERIRLQRKIDTLGRIRKRIKELNVRDGQSTL